MSNNDSSQIQINITPQLSQQNRERIQNAWALSNVLLDMVLSTPNSLDDESERLRLSTTLRVIGENAEAVLDNVG